MRIRPCELPALAVLLVVPLHRAEAQTSRNVPHIVPADLPIEQPSTFDLIINLRSARAFGMPLSQDLLARATRVIQ